MWQIQGFSCGCETSEGGGGSGVELRHRRAKSGAFFELGKDVPDEGKNHGINNLGYSLDATKRRDLGRVLHLRVFVHDGKFRNRSFDDLGASSMVLQGEFRRSLRGDEVGFGGTLISGKRSPLVMQSTVFNDLQRC